MKKALLLMIGVLGSVYYGNSTTCPSAQVVPAAPTLPYTQSLVCGTSNDITTANAQYGAYGNYLGGLESVYSWTPTGSYTGVSIAYTGQSWSGIFLYAGCPTSGGTLVAAIASSSTSQTLNLTANLSGGTTYFIVFDTWPTPNSPCTGSFTLTGTLMPPCTVAPSPGNTLSTTSVACPSAPFTLSLQNNPLLSGFAYQWKSSPDGVTYTNIPGATAATYTTSQTAATYYEASVTCVADGTPVLSTPLQVTMSSFLNCYCTSNPQYVYDQDILNVTLGSLNNSSTCSSSAGTGSIQNSYSNFTGVTAPSLARTAAYPLSIEIGACTYVGTNMSKVYIDYNQNGLFTDPGEQVYVSPSAFGNAHVESAFITIPVGAVLGTTRMRVITNETSNASNITPCGNGSYSYGETEDYYVTIAPAPTCPQPTAFVWLEGTTSTASLDWTAGGSETSWVIEYGAPGFTQGTGTTVIVPAGSTTILNGLPANTFYQAYVKGTCSPTDGSFWTGPVSFNTYGLGQYMEADANCGTGFIEISANSTATNLNLADDTETGITLPFPVYYQGSVVSQVRIGNNGGIRFNTLTGDVGYTMDGPGVFPYAQDLGTPQNGGDVYMEVLGTAPNRKLIVEWKDIPHYSASNEATFEFVFEEATSEFYFHYADVYMANEDWDNGADAEIGVRGDQNIDISVNDATYLSENDCAHFYYTNCPKPTDLEFSGISTDEFSMDWATGLSNEGEWIVEFGPHGFVPGSTAGTILSEITSSDQQIPDLAPLTTYDVYVYAACANGDTSIALAGTVQTLPLCADPYGLYGSSMQDSISASWDWFESELPIEGFNLQYGTEGFTLYDGGSTIAAATGVNFDDTLTDLNLMAGVTYDVYVQAVCSGAAAGQPDTSNFVGPFTVTMPLTNDTVCYAEMLNADGTVYIFTNDGATVSNGVVSNQEQTIAPPSTGPQETDGWDNSTISFSTWFTFVAPASGQVRISGTDIGFDGQMAVYKVVNCAQFSTFDLIAANDDAIGGTSPAPNFTVCGLTPGSTYYLMHDSYQDWETGTYSIKISPIMLQAGETGALLEICTGDSVNLYEGITGNDDGGMWMPIVPSIVLANDSVFASAGLAYQTFEFEYRMTDGCAYDSILANVKIFPPSSAGNDGSLLVCRNQPFNLLAGLTGNADFGGTWYNPDAATVPAGNAISNNIPGQYNYKYITGNGVCPNDTSKVLVNVQACDYLGLDEVVFESFNLYPNPTEGTVFVSNVGSTEIFSYEVLDLNGRKVMVKENAISGATVTEIDLNAMETGVYMIHVFNGNAEKTFRVVVK